MVAAILSIAGYSINDTIVVFDRIREELRVNPDATLRDIINGVDEIHFTSSDAAAVLPANYIFVPGDNGTHAFSLGVKLQTAPLVRVLSGEIFTSSTRQ